MSQAGKETTEFKKTQSANTMAWITAVIGIIIAIGPKVAGMAGEDSKWGIIIGSIVIVVGQCQKCLVDLGYINSRTQVKLSENLKNDSKDNS